MEYFLIFGMPFWVIFVWLYLQRKQTIKEFPYKLQCALILMDFFDPDVSFDRKSYKSLETKALYKPFTRPIEYFFPTGKRFPESAGLKNLTRKDLAVRQALLTYDLEGVFAAVYKGGTKIDKSKKSLINCNFATVLFCAYAWHFIRTTHHHRHRCHRLYCQKF